MTLKKTNETAFKKFGFLENAFLASLLNEAVFYISKFYETLISEAFFYYTFIKYKKEISINLFFFSFLSSYNIKITLNFKMRFYFKTLEDIY